MTPEIKHRIEQIKNSEIPKGYKHSKVGIIPEDWEVLRLKDKFDRLSRKNAEGNTNVLTISAQYGLINQEEFFKKAVASDDKSNYYLLQRGEFAYNKSYSNGYPFGAIKRLSRYDKGVVSPLYICFSANADNACPEYYEQYFEAGKMNHEIQAFAQEGARNHGLLNISVSDFFNSFILVPPVAEQEKIAKILSAQDKVIECYEKKIEQLKLMKKYYLQNMFPKRGETVPKIRFNGFTDPWEQRKASEITSVAPFKQYLSEAKDDGEYEVIQQGDKPILGYANGSPFMEYEKTTLFGDHTLSLYKTKSPFFVASDGLKILYSDGMDGYFYYYLLEKYKPESEGYKRHFTILKGSECSFPKLKDEQEKIGKCFNGLDNLITLHQRKLEEEKKKKKALQQLLLTGIVRTN